MAKTITPLGFDFTINSAKAEYAADDRNPSEAGVVPFFLRTFKNSPLTLRILEVVLAAVNWTVYDHSSGTYPVGSDDVVILAAAGTVVTLPTLASPDIGRIIIVKNDDGDAGANAITINKSGASDTIDGATSFSLNASYGAVVFIANRTNTWHPITVLQ